MGVRIHPGRNIVLEGENSLGQSWYDQETTMFLEYPDNWCVVLPRLNCLDGVTPRTGVTIPE